MTKTCTRTWVDDYWRGDNWYYVISFSCGGTMTDMANYNMPGTPTVSSDDFSYCPFCGKPLKHDPY